MGVKDLPLVIKTVAKEAIVEKPFTEFKNITVAVDTSLLMNQCGIAIRNYGVDMVNERGELTSHLNALFYKCLGFLQNEMVPIMVFDGKAPTIKSVTSERRTQRKLEASKKIENISDTDDPEYVKHFKQTFRLRSSDITEATILLDLMGIPYIIAPEEADVVCAWLSSRKNKNGKLYADGVCSDDSDMLAFGASYLFKDMLKSMGGKKPVKAIKLKKVLRLMNLSYPQFVDMCVLLGTDYCDRIKGVTPKKAYNLISEHQKLSNVIKYLKSTGIDVDNNKCIREAAIYFKNATRQLDQSKDFKIKSINLKLRRFQPAELLDFMCIKHNFDPDRIQNGINRLNAYHQKMGVTTPNPKIVHILSGIKITDSIDDIDILSSSEEMITKKNSKRKNILKQLKDST